MEEKKPWGQLTTIDLHECDKELIKDEEKLKAFTLALSETIEMQPYGEPIVKRLGKDELEGYSAILFIETSTITVHLDEVGKRAFIDIFSCKQFDAKKAEQYCKEYYKATNAHSTTLMRG